MTGHYYIPALYNAAMKISVYECFITHTFHLFHIKTHGSELRGQEEAACVTTTVSYLHGWQL